MPLRVVRRERSPHLYLRGSIRGIRVYETTGTHDAKAAEALRIKREGELLERSVFGPGASVTFAEAAASYLESGGEARFLGRFNKRTHKWTLLIGELGTARIGQIGQEQADRAARSLYPDAKSATRKRQCYVPICAVLNHAAAKGWCARPSIRHPKVKEPETRWSTPERLAKLLPHCKPQLRLLIVLLVYTGARLAEALRIDWDNDVKLALRSIALRRTKNGKLRTVHVPDPLLMELAGVPDARRCGPMFKWKHKTSVYVPLQNACKRAGVDYLPPHQQGRHTYATWLRTYGGLDLVGLKEAGGWESIQSVVRYAHVTQNESSRAADKLPDVVQNACTRIEKQQKAAAG